MVEDARPGGLGDGRTLKEGGALRAVAVAGPGPGFSAVPGTVLGGRFVVEGLLGSGGMGWVVLARHRELGELRAIKLLRPDRDLSDESRRRLVREARAAARIKSAHVVRVFDVVSEGPDAPYVVMEYLTGETLAARLARGPLTQATAARIVTEACEALAEAHAAGTVHRDLKPSNLFLTSREGSDAFVKVLDFGIAKTEESRAADWTHSHALMASPPYASPEQLRASKDVDARSDIWSLGVILYESLAGLRPFEGVTLAELSSRILRDDPDPLRRFRPDVPAELELIVARCLRKVREERFPDVAALVDALAGFASAADAENTVRIRSLGPLEARPLPSDPAGDGADQRRSTLTQGSFAPISGEEPSRRLLARRRLIGALSTVAVLASAALLAWFGRERLPGHGEAPPPPRGWISALPAGPAAAPHASPGAAGRDQPPRLPASDLALRRRHPRVPRVTSTAPTPLEQLPLDELIDERK